MVNEKEWLNEKFPTKESREAVTELDISNEKLEGSLDLTDFKNLEKLLCDGYSSTEEKDEGELTSLDISNLKKLKHINCAGNKITSIKTSGSDNIEHLGCRGNKLTSIDALMSGLNPEKLSWLSISDNNFPKSGLTSFSKFINLEQLWLGSLIIWDKEKNQRVNFAGSLEPLAGLVKLKELDISDTNLDNGLEYLPEGIEVLWCSIDEKKGAKVKILEEELRKFGESKDNNFADLLLIWKEFNGTGQKWLDQNYPENGKSQRETSNLQWNTKDKKRGEVAHLDISKQNLKKGLRLKDFTDLKRLNCSNNQLTDLDLSDCPGLIELKCDKNAFKNLNFLTSLVKLEKLSISDCPKLKGSLKIFENLTKLEYLDISNTDIKEGLECLSPSVKKFYCELNYDYGSVEIAKELSKFSEEEKDSKHMKYNLDKWRKDKANNITASNLPLERLFVIRSNLKQFLNKWGKRSDSGSLNELSKLQSPEQYSKFRYLGGIKWIARATAVTGGILALNEQPVIGGSLAAASPLVDTIASHIEENYYQKREEKWKEFLADADTFLDSYHELLGITKAIKAGNLGEVNEAFRSLDKKVKEFLGEYDQLDESGEKNGEIDLEELIAKRKDLADDLAKDKKESKVWEIVNTMKDLEKKVTDYRQGIDVENIEEAKEPETIDNSPKDDVIVSLEDITNQSLISSQANLLDKPQKEEIEMQNQEQQAQILQNQPPKK